MLQVAQSRCRDAAPLFQSFDPATKQWRDLAPIPEATSHPGIAALNGKIYIAGGFTMNVHKNPLALFAEYDIATNSWRELPPLPQPLGSVSLAALDGKIHMIGGRKPDGSDGGDALCVRSENQSVEHGGATTGGARSSLGWW